MVVINVATDTRSEPDETAILVTLKVLSSVVDWRCLMRDGST